MVLEDMRANKDSTPDDFLVVLMFFKNLSAKPGKLVKFTRSKDKLSEKKWEDTAKAKIIGLNEEGKKDII